MSDITVIMERLLRKVAMFEARVKAALMAFAAVADDRFGFAAGQVRDALPALELELDSSNSELLVSQVF